jgi:hypothetical protein
VWVEKIGCALVFSDFGWMLVKITKAVIAVEYAGIIRRMKLGVKLLMSKGLRLRLTACILTA